MPDITPSATVGPYFAYGLTPKDYDWSETFSNNLVTPDAAGERTAISGSVLDGDGLPVPDAMVEIWQADAAGRYADRGDDGPPSNSAFKGFGRCGTDAAGQFSFETIKPGAVPGPEGAVQAPHILVAVFARGMLRQIFTRIYFSDEAANVTDPVLSMVPADRQATLIAKREDGNGRAGYRFDIHLQGEDETVFFDL